VTDRAWQGFIRISSRVRCELVDAFDVIRDLAYPLRATVVGGLLGVPLSDWTL
jgi:hypothetical protein